jgi:hypothetical protein
MSSGIGLNSKLVASSIYRDYIVDLPQLLGQQRQRWEGSTTIFGKRSQTLI